MDLIKDRLAHIIRAKNLTATQFAEMMQIQPSNVSHLLSGRNKPSLDFLIKLKDVFPEYSFDWIILGKKPITVSERPQTIKDEVVKSMDFSPAIETGVTNIQNLFDKVEENKPEPIDEKADCAIEYSKKVAQIVYIYEDHTFEIYNLRK